MARRGSVLTVLLAATIGLVLVTAIASGALSGLQFGTRQSNRESARNAAESVLALSIDQLLTDHRFGQSAQPGFDRVLGWRAEVGPDARGRLTFDPDLALAEGLPRSTNNFDSDVPVEGEGGRTVPPDTVHLAALGECRRAVRRVEVFLHIPPYPYVVSASGACRSRGAVLVGQVPVPGAVTGLEPESLRPGHLLSNHPGQDAVHLGGTSLVKGDVRTAGGAEIADEARVEGRLLEGQEPFPIPTIDLSDYDPAGRPGLVTLTEPRLAGAELSGLNRREGNLTVEAGLKLENGVLFVDGDLAVNGGVHGRGALIVTGTTTIRDGAALQTDNQVALLSGGDVTLKGNGTASSFRGLVYTEGNLQASELTLVGAFVANGEKSGAAGGMELSDARLLHDPQAQALKFAVTSHSSSVVYPFHIYYPYSGQDLSFLNKDRTAIGPIPETAEAHLPTALNPGLGGQTPEISTFVVAFDQGSGTLSLDWWAGRSVPMGSVPVSGEPTAEDVMILLNTSRAVYVRSGVSVAPGDERLPDAARRQLAEAIAEAFQTGSTELGPTTQQDDFSIDLNRFLKVEDRIRILLWK